jgi:hypothetical protein
VVLRFALFFVSGLNRVVVSVADCYSKGGGFDSRVLLGYFSLRKRGLRTLVSQINIEKEKKLSRNPEREGPNSTRCCASICFYFYFIFANKNKLPHFNGFLSNITDFIVLNFGKRFAIDKNCQA